MANNPHKRYLVHFYHKGDDQMDFPQTTEVWAVDEDDADEVCQKFYPGCTTTHIEEAEDDES